jgi:eukaryotic-like serine/threonine-protein kinase
MRHSMKNQEITAGHILPSIKTECPTCGVRYEDLSFVCPDDGTVLIEEPAPGTTLFACYEYRSMLGAGGGGVVFKARHQVLDIEVAVKMLLRNHSFFDVRRFQQEAKAACLLQHENIVYVREFGVSEHGQPYMIMEYLNGQSLDHVIKHKGPMAIDEAHDIFTGIFNGMSYAHRKGVVHRDLKPSNIMLTNNEGESIGKVVDFGIAKIIEGRREGLHLTRTGEVFGSPMYMSPEQALGKPVDFRTDIYSAGCVLYYALTGKPPLSANNTLETLFKHINETPPTLAEASGGKPFPGQLEKVVAKSLAKNPADRYSNFNHFAAEFSQAIHSKPVLVLTSKTPGPVTTAVNKVPIALVVCSFIVAVALAIESRFSLQHADAKPKLAAALFDRGGGSSEDLTALADLTPLGITKTIADQTMKVDARDGYEFDLSDQTTDLCVKYIVQQISKKHAEVARLDLAKCMVSNNSMEMLSTIPIKRLSISETKVTGVGLRAVGKISTLEELRAVGLKDVTDQDLASLGKLRRLRVLDLRNDSLANFDLSFLGQLKHLTVLDLGYTSISNRVMLHVSKLRDLNELCLGRCKVTDDGIRELRGLTSLHIVDLIGCSITTDSVRSLSNNQLWKLYLDNTNIDDAALELLHKQECLAELSISGCRFLTTPGIAALQRALPNCHITARRPFR